MTGHSLVMELRHRAKIGVASSLERAQKKTISIVRPIVAMAHNSRISYKTLGHRLTRCSTWRMLARLGILKFLAQHGKCELFTKLKGRPRKDHHWQPVRSSLEIRSPVRCSRWWGVAMTSKGHWWLNLLNRLFTLKKQMGLKTTPRAILHWIASTNCFSLCSFRFPNVST